ncbi:MAG TPA: hypothetical protein PKN80_06700 [bacterium]|uniref:Alpha-galacturonidase n=1 Tax=candidate division TA06 bacterium ADurb.Bin417 TaxID=1852828 RepID=A0A1V5MJ18_UNCT6|nr:MAG: Alpha-galacturonidase [candidate division TA06 bacterium ADurb.Bin417]HNQ35738.1 hypothetical protein [bacterium]HNS48207.1 hypothetical protein [bacterium]
MVNVCFLGSGLAWTPRLLIDLVSVFKDEKLDIRLVDINPENADLIARYGAVVNRQHGRRDRYRPLADRRAGLKGADAVIIALSTGGLDAMEQDIAIPEKYAIFATVGDTAGPSGWSRAVRNIPVFAAFAEDLEAICPKAFVTNYTNPMSALSATLQLGCSNPSVGLCHAYFETKDVIKEIFGLPDWSRISISVAGMNHFTWVVDFKIGREDGYRLLRERIGRRGSLRDVLPKESTDEIGFTSRSALCCDLYDAFGYLPYPADRHTSEFVSFALCGRPERTTHRDKDGNQFEAIRYCAIRRTAVAARKKGMANRPRNVEAYISGRTPLPTRTRETGIDMIAAYLYNRPLFDVANLLNHGQVPGLPADACVETLAMIDGLGVRPLLVDRVPEPLLEIMRPQAVNQKWTVEGVLKKDRDLLFQALYNDPMCRHLKPGEIRRMGEELLKANRRWFKLP